MSTTYTSEPIPGSYCFEGSANAPHVAIISGIHGDETPGIHATHELLSALCDEIDFLCGKISLLLVGNVLAAREGKRFLEKDMNRQFMRELIAEVRRKAGKGLPFCYEEGRASQIARFIQDADVVVDIHATTKPTPAGFIVCARDQTHWQLAKLFGGVGYVVLDPGTDGPLDQYAAREGKIALTYESGHLADETVTSRIVDNCKMVLSLMGNAFRKYKVSERKEVPTPIEFYGKIEMQEPFSTPHDYHNFDTVEEGSLIAVTGGIEVLAEERTHIIFPKKNPQQGDTALELARSVDPVTLPQRLYMSSSS